MRLCELAGGRRIGYLVALQVVAKTHPHLSDAFQIESNSNVSVIIVNYNGGQDIIDCLESLRTSQKNANLEIIVVDNNSTDGSTEKIKSQFESIRIIELGENRGFAAACNAGIETAQAKTILLLNPDTLVVDDAIGKMYRTIVQHPNWGIIGARMLNAEGVPYRAARRFPTPRAMAFTAIGLAKLFPSSQLFNGYLYGERSLESLDDVEQIEGSCLMISETARKAVGDLDDKFFIFFEEVDWCKRVKAAGFEIHIVNHAEVIHKVSTTMGRYYEFTRKIHAQSAMKFFRKHEGETGYNAIRNIMKNALLIRAIVLALPALFNIGGARKRLKGTLVERSTYVEGLTT